MRIARYYCPTAHETFSLLPDCLASHFPGALDPIEQVVATVEAARSVEAAADVLRPDITLPSAVRWVRRRLRPIRLALLTVVTLVRDRFTGDARLAAVRAALATSSALMALPAPLGLLPRASRRDARPSATHTGRGQTAPAPTDEDPARRGAAARRTDAAKRHSPKSPDLSAPTDPGPADLGWPPRARPNADDPRARLIRHNGAIREFRPPASRKSVTYRQWINVRANTYMGDRPFQFLGLSSIDQPS